MKKYQERLYNLQTELWVKFEALVKTGALLPSISVEYPRGINPKGLYVDSEGISYFLASKLIANPNYILNNGEDLIISTNIVEFVDVEENTHKLEPNIIDLDWLAELIDTATPLKK